jgi:hypothetical protein
MAGFWGQNRDEAAGQPELSPRGERFVFSLFRPFAIRRPSQPFAGRKRGGQVRVFGQRLCRQRESIDRKTDQPPATRERLPPVEIVPPAKVIECLCVLRDRSLGSWARTTVDRDALCSPGQSRKGERAKTRRSPECGADLRNLLAVEGWTRRRVWARKSLRPPSRLASAMADPRVKGSW